MFDNIIMVHNNGIMYGIIILRDNLILKYGIIWLMYGIMYGHSQYPGKIMG
jgi:hypothetical protein